MPTKAFSEYTISVFLRNVSAKCLSFDLGILKISKGAIRKEFSSIYLPKQKLTLETTWTFHFKTKNNLTKYVQRDWKNNYIIMTLGFFVSQYHIQKFLDNYSRSDTNLRNIHSYKQLAYNLTQVDLQVEIKSCILTSFLAEDRVGSIRSAPFSQWGNYSVS